MKQLLQNLRNGKTLVVDVPAPTPRPGTALVRTAASLVSAGTERMLVEFAEKSWWAKRARAPTWCARCWIKPAARGCCHPGSGLQPPGPAHAAGLFLRRDGRGSGRGLQGFQVGDRVACAGGGYAVHAEYAVVPQNLLALAAG